MNFWINLVSFYKSLCPLFLQQVVPVPEFLTTGFENFLA